MIININILSFEVGITNDRQDWIYADQQTVKPKQGKVLGLHLFCHRRTCTTGACSAQFKAPDLCLRNEAERSGLAAPSALRPGQTRTNNASSLIFCPTLRENNFTPKTRHIYPK